MIELEILRQILNQSLHLPAKEVSLNKLPGDASNRTYYRLSWTSDPSSEVKSGSFILMVLAEPEGFKASEEAVSGAASSIAELPFINIQRHLRACKVAVPEIVFYDAPRGWLLLEDLGDVTLSQEIEKNIDDKGMVLDYYRKAIDELLIFHLDGTPAAVPSLGHQRSFDQSLFVWEFDHFIEYGIEKRKGMVLPEKEKIAIRSYFSDIAFRLASLPQVFTHRDYHSRNLMVQLHPGGFKIRVIDFQDALMGPSQYDLASLLRDSYIDLPEEIVDQLILYYIQQWESRSGKEIRQEMFREFFDLVSIQRNLKAAGRFVYIDQVKKNNRFLPYIPPTLAKVKRNLQKHRRLAPLHHLLAEYVEEFQ
jgi:aminoglycoside/choline kinase family phosphotransferase